MNISLKENVAEPFYPLFNSDKYNYIFLTSGRNAAKSTVASIWDVYTSEREEGTHSLYIRQVADTLKTSCHNQVLWVLEKLGLSANYDYSTIRTGDITNRNTGNKFIFRGLDDADKVKSIKLHKGYIKKVIFEEFDQLRGEEREINKVIRSITRGVKRGNFKFIFIMNPPQDKNHWANQYLEKMKMRPDVLHIHTDYRSMPTEWVSEEFIKDAEYSKQLDYKNYEWEFLGIANSDGSDDSLIKMEHLRQALVKNPKYLHTDVCDIGVDVARFGEDRTEIYARIGNDATVFHKELVKVDTMGTVGEVMNTIKYIQDKYDIEKINVKIDDTGLGGGVTDRLNELRPNGVSIYPINNGNRCRNKTRIGHNTKVEDVVSNVGTEMWYLFNNLLIENNEVIKQGGKPILAIPHDYELLDELSNRNKERTSNGKLRLEGKETLRKRIGKSPDKADALMLCFYEDTGSKWGWN